jgi:hypothetical protein
MNPDLTTYHWILLNSLCAAAHKEFSAAQSVMWPWLRFPQSTGPSTTFCAT